MACSSRRTGRVPKIRGRLVDDAKRIARGRGATRIDVVANPQVVAFYEARDDSGGLMRVAYVFLTANPARSYKPSAPVAFAVSTVSAARL
jgi:hypothetical protein